MEDELHRLHDHEHLAGRHGVAGGDANLGHRARHLGAQLVALSGALHGSACQRPQFAQHREAPTCAEVIDDSGIAIARDDVAARRAVGRNEHEHVVGQPLRTDGLALAVANPVAAGGVALDREGRLLTVEREAHAHCRAPARGGHEAVAARGLPGVANVDGVPGAIVQRVQRGGHARPAKGRHVVMPAAGEGLAEKARRQPAAAKEWMVDDGAQQTLVGADAGRLEGGEAVAQPLDRRGTRGAVADQLGDHRVVVRRDDRAGGDAAVDAQPGQRRLDVAADGAELWPVVVGRVFAIHARLDRPSGDGDVGLRERQRLAGGDADLPLDEVEPGHLLGDRVLDLQPRVHLEEVRHLRALGEHEFHRAERVIADRAAELERRVEEPLADDFGQTRRGRLLDHLLVVTLDRAFALEQMNEVSVRIAGELHFEVARPLDQLFEQHPLVAEGAHRLALGKLELDDEVGEVIDAAHALAAATRAGLDEQRHANGARLLEQQFRLLRFAVVTRHAQHPGTRGNALRFDLRAHALDHVGARPDPGDAVLDAATHELCALGEKAIARMDGARARGDGRLHDGIRIEVAAYGIGRADAHGRVGFTHVTGAGVGIRVDGDGAQAEPACGADDAASDLAAIGDQ